MPERSVAASSPMAATPRMAAAGEARAISGASLRRLLSWVRRGFKPRATQMLSGSEHVYVTNPWHAVAVTVGNGNCCQASTAIKRQRFLSQEAPSLPLKGCRHPLHCACVYKHFSDRRAGPRRADEQESYRPPMGNQGASEKSQERRRSKGRRAMDGH